MDDNEVDDDDDHYYYYYYHHSSLTDDVVVDDDDDSSILLYSIHGGVGEYNSLLYNSSYSHSIHFSSDSSFIHLSMNH